MSAIRSRWYEKYSDMIETFDDEELYETIYSLIGAGQNVFSLNSRVMKKAVDITWVEAIEKTMLHLDNVIRSPRMTIEDVENIVPIALSRKITVESVKHLAQHTNLIQDYDARTGKVTPSKVLNVYKEESMMTYENKFVNTLIDRLYVFINRRYDKLREVRNDEAVSALEYTSAIGGEGNKMHVSLKLESVDSLETVDGSGATTWERIEKIKSTIESYKASPFCRKMGTAYIRPPVMRTNAILKNVDLKACLTLWQFIESYDKVGYELTVSDTAQKPDDDYIEDMYRLMALGFMLMRYHSDSAADLKKQKPKTHSPKIIRKFDKSIEDELDMTIGIGMGEEPGNNYAPSSDLPVDADEILEEFDKIIELENSYFEEEERLEAEAQRLAEERERKRQEAERKRLEEERQAAIRAEKERLEQEQREREEKERQLQEMREQQKREQEERERQEREEAERREQERIEKARIEAEEAAAAEAKAAAEMAESIRQAAAALTEEERQRMEEEAEQERIRKEEEKAARLAREKAEAERAIHLRRERELIEQKPFEQIYLEYSMDFNAIFRRGCIRLAKRLHLYREKPLSELEQGIRDIEERCQRYYEAEQAELRRKRSEERQAANRYDQFSSSPLARVRIFYRNVAEKWDNRDQH